MGRIILGIVAGILAMAATVGAIEFGAHELFPVPSDTATVPFGVELVVIAAYFIGALIGGLVAARISAARWTVWVIAIVVVGGALWSMFLIPHPQWMQIAAVVAPVLGALVASRLAGTSPAP